MRLPRKQARWDGTTSGAERIITWARETGTEAWLETYRDGRRAILLGDREHPMSAYPGDVVLKGASGRLFAVPGHGAGAPHARAA